jgi:hypothetical protein
VKLAQLLGIQKECHGPERFARSVGDGYLYLHNPFFRRIRQAALAGGYRFTQSDPGGYFGFPLLSLDVVLATRQLPYRDNLAALLALERARPGFFRLADLQANRPTPNYLLHEAAHAVAFHQAFKRPRDVLATLAERNNLLYLITGEAFAMSSEYLAACSVTGALQRWCFSISSYRRRVQGSQLLGQLMLELGQRRVVWALLGGFVASNYLCESISHKELRRLLSHQPGAPPLPSSATLSKLRSGVARATQMSREFRYDTARLFLTKLGYPRDIERVLGGHPLDDARADASYFAFCDRLVNVLLSDGPQ